MLEIKPLTSEYEGYCRDESRSVGKADSISFPETEEEVRKILCQLHAEKVPVTVQGGRTGLAGAAVPQGGHVMNLSKMNRVTGMRRSTAGYRIRVQPGVVLSSLRKVLENRMVDYDGWDSASVEAWKAFEKDREFFFPTDPTETSACLGGIVACNASGARSFRYGAARNYVTGLHVILADGSMLRLYRGRFMAEGRSLKLRTEEGREMQLSLPTYQMPRAKNASGYFVEDNMDAVDLLVGSDGTLGVVTEIELQLLPLPPVIWGISCFFASEEPALTFTELVREKIPQAAAIEFFDAAAIEILRKQKKKSTAFSALPDVEQWVNCCIFGKPVRTGRGKGAGYLGG